MENAHVCTIQLVVVELVVELEVVVVVAVEVVVARVCRIQLVGPYHALWW